MALKLRFGVKVRSYINRVVNRLNGKRKKMLLRQGQYIRRVAMNSIKRGGKGKISLPGGPPVSHTGVLKNWIRYAWDPVSQTVVIGPMRLKHFRAPRALEWGGTSKWIRRTRTFWRSGYQRVRARPFMRPALRRSIPRMRLITASVYRR